MKDDRVKSVDDTSTN